MKHYISIMEFLFSFDGRIGRARYWSFIGVAVLLGWSGLSFVATLPDAVQNPDGAAVNAIRELISLAVFLPLMVAGFSFSVRRWHDRNRTGWCVLLSFVPVIGPIWTFVDCGCLRGTIGENRYGPDPLAPGIETVFE